MTRHFCWSPSAERAGRHADEDVPLARLYLRTYPIDTVSEACTYTFLAGFALQTAPWTAVISPPLPARRIFAATGVVHVLRPFATHPTREIVAMPKVYAFDTGFVCHARSIDALRADDKGGLFEHLVLDELLFEAGGAGIHYWRDKQRHEIDFVWTPRGRPPVAIECKWRAAGFDPTAIQSFATLHPDAAFCLVAEDRRSWTVRRHGGIEVFECGPEHLAELMQATRGAGARIRDDD